MDKTEQYQANDSREHPGGNCLQYSPLWEVGSIRGWIDAWANPKVLSGRWVGDARSFAYQQPGIAGKGSCHQEKLHNLKHCRNPQQNHKVLDRV